jgi:integration host factor subunit beta
MNKSTLVDTLRKETDLTKVQAEQVVDLFFDKMSNALAAGDRVEIRGLFSILTLSMPIDLAFLS